MDKTQLENIFLSITFGFRAICFILAGTTAIAGYSMGLTIVPNVFVGVGVAILLAAAIDGTLAELFSYTLLKRGRVGFMIWGLLIALSLATGATSWVSISFIGDLVKGESYLSVVDQHQLENSKRRQLNTSLENIAEDMSDKDQRLKALRIEREESLSDILSGANRNHKSLILNGRYKDYYRKKGYESLTALVDEYLNRKDYYTAQEKTLEAELLALSSKKTNLLSKDLTKSSRDAVINQNGTTTLEKRDLIKRFRTIEIIFFIGMWLTYGGMLHMVIHDGMKAPSPKRGFLPSVMVGLGTLQEKALKTDTKLDDHLVGILIGFANIIGAIFRLIGGGLNFIATNLLRILGEKPDGPKPPPPPPYEPKPRKSEPEKLSKPEKPHMPPKDSALDAFMASLEDTSGFEMRTEKHVPEMRTEKHVPEMRTEKHVPEMRTEKHVPKEERRMIGFQFDFSQDEKEDVPVRTKPTEDQEDRVVPVRTKKHVPETRTKAQPALEEGRVVVYYNGNKWVLRDVTNNISTVRSKIKKCDDPVKIKELQAKLEELLDMRTKMKRYGKNKG